MALEDDAEESEAGFRPVDAEMSAYQLWQLQKQKRDLRKEYLDHWEETIKVTGTGRPVDVIISPVAPYAAPPHGSNRSVYEAHHDHAPSDWSCSEMSTIP
jgi:amidase